MYKRTNRKRKKSSAYDAGTDGKRPLSKRIIRFSVIAAFAGLIFLILLIWMLYHWIANYM